MKHWPLRIINYVTGLLFLSGVHCIFASLFLENEQGIFLYSLLYLPVVIILSEAQKRAVYFWQFAVFAGIATAIVAVFSRSGLEQILSIILTLTAAGCYFYARATEKKCMIETPAYQYILIFVLMYFFDLAYPSELLETYAVVGAGTYFLLCMYKANVSEMISVFYASEKLERFPKKRLIKNNLLMMGIQTIFVVGGMSVAVYIGEDGVLNAIKTFISKIIELIMALVKPTGGSSSSEGLGSQNGPITIEPTETSPWMELLSKLVEILSTVFVIALVVYVIYLVLKKLYQLYLNFDVKTADNGDKIEKLYVANTKEEKRALRKQKKENLFWDRTPNARIRKYYKKRVLKDLKETPKPHMTPEEIEVSVVMEQERKQLFHSLYEKARYGDIECSKEESEKMLKI